MSQPSDTPTPETNAYLGKKHLNGITIFGHAQRLERQRDAAREEAAMWRMHIKTCLQYPRGSEAQVRCLEEVGGDAAYMEEKHKKELK